jgi:hypothetical protein
MHRRLDVPGKKRAAVLKFVKNLPTLCGLIAAGAATHAAAQHGVPSAETLLNTFGAFSEDKGLIIRLLLAAYVLELAAPITKAVTAWIKGLLITLMRALGHAITAAIYSLIKKALKKVVKEAVAKAAGEADAVAAATGSRGAPTPAGNHGQRSAKNPKQGGGR